MNRHSRKTPMISVLKNQHSRSQVMFFPGGNSSMTKNNFHVTHHYQLCMNFIKDHQLIKALLPLEPKVVSTMGLTGCQAGLNLQFPSDLTVG